MEWVNKAKLTKRKQNKINEIWKEKKANMTQNCDSSSKLNEHEGKQTKKTQSE